MLVEAGLPHAIGAGVFTIEIGLQESADLLVMLEWEPFGIDGKVPGGVDAELALQCLDR